MIRRFASAMNVVVPMVLGLTAISLSAQTAPSQSGSQKPSPAEEVRKTFTEFKQRLMAAAERMPETAVDFKPTAEDKTFGRFFIDVAGATFLPCWFATNGNFKANLPAEWSTAQTKAAVLKALVEAFSYCDSALAKLSDADVAQRYPINGIYEPNIIRDVERYERALNSPRISADQFASKYGQPDEIAVGLRGRMEWNYEGPTIGLVTVVVKDGYLEEPPSPHVISALQERLARRAVQAQATAQARAVSEAEEAAHEEQLRATSQRPWADVIREAAGIVTGQTRAYPAPDAGAASSAGGQNGSGTWTQHAFALEVKVHAEGLSYSGVGEPFAALIVTLRGPQGQKLDQNPENTNTVCDASGGDVAYSANRQPGGYHGSGPSGQTVRDGARLPPGTYTVEATIIPCIWKKGPAATGFSGQVPLSYSYIILHGPDSSGDRMVQVPARVVAIRSTVRLGQISVP